MVKKKKKKEEKKSTSCVGLLDNRLINEQTNAHKQHEVVDVLRCHQNQNVHIEPEERRSFQSIKYQFTPPTPPFPSIT